MEHDTTDRLSDQQQRYLQHRSQTSTSMWTATGQAVQKQEDQQRALSLVITLLGASWSNNQLRQPNAGNDYILKCRSRVVCNQHRGYRSTTPTPTQPPHGDLQRAESQHQDLQRLVKWQKHGNKDRIIKEIKTHQPETPLYSTTDLA